MHKSFVNKKFILKSGGDVPSIKGQMTQIYDLLPIPLLEYYVCTKFKTEHLSIIDKNND